MLTLKVRKGTLEKNYIIPELSDQYKKLIDQLTKEGFLIDISVKSGTYTLVETRYLKQLQQEFIKYENILTWLQDPRAAAKSELIIDKKIPNPSESLITIYVNVKLFNRGHKALKKKLQEHRYEYIPMSVTKKAA